MDPTEGRLGPAEMMANEHQNVTAANQPTTSQNGIREGEGGEEKIKAEEEEQEPVLPTLTREQFMDASLDVIIRRNAAAAELEYLERQALTGLESGETLKAQSDQLRARLEALLSEQLRLASYNQRRH
ncbi:uncharacterized protein N7503_001460 [Penicillium pulvis]|uniref:uncharacterized protein n=1 Tax=Penicillium pulvis TaxID=1562058 RepID=UPI002548B3A2|nr:uncharacterized protein N7503_001460 [Penicillium pulvis]KAJ5809242.1 hypothetical protein N7503_001460 [Penicillium pulvis]